MFSREIGETLKRYKNFPVIAILGPRQSGKTTFVKAAFPKHKFFSMDDQNTRSFAEEDPERFLSSYENEHGIILDEVQYVPKMTTYLKLHVDRKKRPSYFIITGSQNFLLNQTISESLAGRVGILNLLPFSLGELDSFRLLENKTVDEVMLNGFYPRVYDEHILAMDFYPSYIQTYLERDIRMLINVTNLSVFQRFLSLCAGRIGNILNIESLGNECGVSSTTIRNWLSLLEASYVIFLLQPHFSNFNKRVTKSPKLYFFDTGIACSLLRITNTQTLAVSPFRAALFESLVISDLYKQFCHNGHRPPLYFWRDQSEHEVDCLIDKGSQLLALEIKSGQTITNDFFKGLKYWQKLVPNSEETSFLVYGGDQDQNRSTSKVLGWKQAGHWFKSFY